jgi:hypothetical protein
MRYLAVAVVVVLSSLVPCRAQNLLPNPEFDHDVSGWAPPSSYPATLSWDNTRSVLGLGGSALIQTPFGIGGFLCITACAPVTPGVVYSFGGQYQFPVRAGTHGVEMSVTFTSDAGCLNGIADFDSPLQNASSTPAGVWQVLAGPDATAPPGAVAALYAACQNSFIDPETHASNFDDLYFGRQGTVGPNQAPLELPTLSWTGLFTLIFGLASAALWVLRRRATTRLRAS